MPDGSPADIPADLAQVAQEKGLPLDLIRRALALGFPPEGVKQQISMPGVTAETAEQFIAEQERIRAGGDIVIPDELVPVAKEHGWPDELVKRALRLGASPAMLVGQIKSGVSVEQAEQFISQQEHIRAGGEITIPPQLAETAAKHGWPEELLKRALALGAQPEMLISQMESGVRSDQAERFIEQQERFRQAPEQALDLSWMRVPTEWGVRVRPGKKGLTVGMLNVGTYADIPDVWPYRTEMPRGAYPIAGVPSMGYTIYEKAELWSDNAADLYEEAIQRRWRPATDIPWDTLEPLPDEIERAMCQLCTFFCEKALLAGDVVGKWLPEMSYGYHEIKLYLATAEFDAARHFEVFRKRALANGGGMGLQSPGYFHRAIIDARAWTETSAVLHVLSNSFLIGLYQLGQYVAHNEAESKIFRLCVQDIARQLAYGAGHLQYFLSRKQDRRDEVHAYLNKAEAIFVYEEEQDTPLREALIILLGGGLAKEQVLDGVRKLEYFKRRWVRHYLARLAHAGLPERRERLHPNLRKHVEEPVAQAA